MQALWDLVGQWSSTEVRLSEACCAHLLQKTQDLTEAQGSAEEARGQLAEAQQKLGEAKTAQKEAERQLARHTTLYQSRLSAVAEAVRMSREGGVEAVAQTLAMAKDCGDPDVFSQECETLQSRIAEAESHVVSCDESVTGAEQQLRLRNEVVETIEAQMREIKTIQRQIEKKVD